MTVFQGKVIRLSDYLGTRVVEQGVHLDDLARSVGREPWPLPKEHHAVTISVATDIACRVHGPDATVRALYRTRVRRRASSRCSSGGPQPESTGEAGDAVTEQLGPQHEQHNEHDDGVVVRHELLDGAERAFRFGGSQHVKHDGPGDRERTQHDKDGDGDGVLARPEAGLSDRAGGGDGRARFFGLAADRAAPKARDLAGVKPSIVSIHFGMVGSSPFFGRFCHWAAARNKNTAPSASLMALTAVEVPPCPGSTRRWPPGGQRR